jgi:serine O-acetyltransferase
MHPQRDNMTSGSLQQDARPGISDEIPDWSREDKTFWEWAPSRSLLASIRCWQRNRKSRNPLRKLLTKLAVLQHRFWSVVTGADIPVNCNLGGGLLLPHPNGVVIHPDIVIGPNCLIFQQVTLGSNGRGVPAIGGHVDIGAGAKVIGPIKIGAHARIGANSVVTSDVLAHSVVAGIPARVVPRTLT